MKKSLSSHPRFASYLLLVVVGGACASSLIGGCSAGTQGNGGSGGGGAGATGSNATGNGGFGGGFTDGSTGTGSTQSLVIQPQNPVVDYTTPPVTQQFTALLEGQGVTANWSLDNVGLGTIDANGLFNASGAYGGLGTISAQYGQSIATTTITVKLHLNENLGNVSAATIAQLQAGGTADSGFRWLYPYDATVFPRGLKSPTLQFGGTAPDAVWVHAESTTQGIVYDGFYGGSNPARVQLSDASWKAVLYSVGSGETLSISVTKISGGQVTGPMTEKWRVAQAPLKGTLYYNSYDSQLASGIGALLKLKPGQNAQLLEGGSGKCTVCHSVAANGSVVLASDTGYSTGAKYDLTNNGAESGSRGDYAYNFPAVYPDGSLAVSTSGQHIGGMWGSNPSALYDVASGAQISAPGLDGAVNYAAMPVFSADGKQFAFNDEDIGDRHTLAIMNFDKPSHTFSGLTQLAHDPANLLGWPAFMPDGKAVLFDVNDSSGSQSQNGEQDYGTWFGNRADISMVDVATKTVTPLDLLNGKSGGQVYLPFGADDARRNFEPNVLPLAVGGYYWVVFTSRRQYGNTINSVETGAYGDTTRKKLWIAAIDINQTPGQDPSHPAVYLEGQELTSGNMRGFWVFDPCKQMGNTCESGDECCTGFCRQTTVNNVIEDLCVPPPATGCSNEFETCTTSADCCNSASGYTCINGHCAAPAPPK